MNVSFYTQNEPLPTDELSPDMKTSEQPSPLIHQTIKKPKPSAKQSPVSSPLKYDRTEQVKKGTPKKKTALERYVNSPKKFGAFGSPEKALTQTTLNKESFSPKKSRTSSDKRIDDNSSHNPPLHANQTDSYGRLHCSKAVVGFSHSQLGYLEGIEEEGDECSSRYIDALLGFVTPYSKPSPDLCFRVLSETLLKSHDNAVSLKAFRALKHIQTIHPVVPEQMSKAVTYEFLEDVVKRLEISGCKCKNNQDTKCPSSLCLKAGNALKALTFIVDVMEKEVKRKISPNKTIAYRLFSLERNSGNICKVLSWINTSVNLCCNYTSVPDFYIILSLFQRLLQLCQSVSENPDKFAESLAQELLNSYSQFGSLECRKVFLQTLPSHLLRSKFLCSYVRVFCEMPEPREHDSSLKGIQQIIESDFLRLPRKRDDVLNLEARMCAGIHRSSEECEEHAMIIASSLQSYLFSHHKRLKCSRKKMALDRETDDDRHLSLNDTEEIVNMADKVQVFAGRMLSLSPSLSDRTMHLIELLSDMRLWDPW